MTNRESNPKQLCSLKQTNFLKNQNFKVNMRNKLIYLTGFMGSGKTTIGNILAEKLDYDFIDLDILIEKNEGRTISDIFKEFGEPYFRRLERENLCEVSDSQSRIVSLGGGALMNEENQRFVKSKGILIYLRVTPEEIYKRIKDCTDRPLLKKDDKTLFSEDEFINKISPLFEKREPGYMTANFIIDTVGKNPEKIAEEVISLISS